MCLKLKITKQSLFAILLHLFFYSQSIYAQNEIKDCNGNSIAVETIIVRSSTGANLTTSNCTFSNGSLSAYLNCIRANNTSLPTTASLIVELTANPASGISGLDFALLKQDVLQSNLISNTCNRVGSDNDMNNKINTIDLCLLRRHNLGISSINPTWKFYKSQNLSLSGIGSATDLVFPVTDFPLSTLHILGVHNGNVNQVASNSDTCVLLCKPTLTIIPGIDEVRKLTPDYFLLNKSCEFPNLTLQITNESGKIIGNDITQNLIFSQLTAQLKIGNTSQICTTKLRVWLSESIVNIDVDQLNTPDSTFVDLIVRNAEFIDGYQLSLKFDTTHLQFTIVEKGNEQGFNESNDAHYNGNGHVNISRFNESSNLGLEEGTRLFRVKFRRKSTVINNVVIDPENVETLFFDSNKNEYFTDITYVKDTQPPVCTQDTINIQALLATGYGIVKFTDYASDDFGTVLFVSGVNEFDIPITEIDSFDCGTNILTYVVFKDANGQLKECVFRVIVDCPMESCNNKYLYFDGINDRINIPNQHTGNINFTLEAWFKSDNIVDQGMNTFHRLFTLGTANRMELGDQSGRLIYFDGSFFPTGPNIRDGKWHHVAIVRESPFVNIVLDGVQIFSRSVTTVDLSSLRIGYFNNNSVQPPSIWKGGIDEIKLWNYALSLDEINNSKNIISTIKKDCGLIGYWRMEEGIPGGNNQAITMIRDSVGNNHGTLVGFDLMGESSNFLCNDSLVFALDDEACCKSSFMFTTYCNRIELKSVTSGFKNPSNLKYTWSSPNINFKSMAKDTVFNYFGDISSVIICLEINDGSCSATFCDTIPVTLPMSPIFQNCPNSVILAIPDKCEMSLNLGFPIAIDPCTTVDAIVYCTRSDGKPINSIFELGKTTVTCTALSVLGNSFNSICQYTVEILDETPPICRAKSAVVYLDNNGTGSLTPNLINNGSSDACSDVTLSILGNQIYNCVQIGTEARVLVVTDMAGNSSSCQAFVEVQDTIKPICKSKTLNKIINTNGNASFAAIDLNDNSTDNCGSLTFTASKTIFICADVVNTNIVTMTVTDQSGNSSSCMAEVKLTDPNNYCACINDVTGPVCKTKNITLDLDSTGNALLTPQLIDNNSFDACSDITLQIEGPLSFDCNSIGSQEVYLVVTDQSNNVAFCSAQVVVQDKIAPTCVLGPSTYNLNQSGQITLDKDNLNITINDNCNSATIISDPITFFCNTTGNRTITVSLRDASGNLGSCTANISIRDIILPTCTLLPKTIYIGNSGTVTVAQGSLDFSVNDNCPGVTTSFNNVTYTCNDIGSKNALLTVTDASGNIGTCTAELTIRDTLRPICTIRDTMVTAVDGIGAMVTFNGIATDNCSDPFIFYSSPSGQLYMCGEYNITMTARDGSGNTSTCPFKLTVKDCDGCCLSESSFMTNTNVDFNLSSDLLNSEECVIQFATPALTECQKVTEISWGDGTVSRGSFTNAVDFTHQYNEPAIYEVCVTYEEANQQNCFNNKKCNSFEVLDNCTLKRSAGQFDYDKIILVPNPTSSSFSISSGSIFSHYTIYDQIGKEVVPKRSIETVNDISHLLNGVYFVRLTVGSINVTKRIIKIQ